MIRQKQKNHRLCLLRTVSFALFSAILLSIVSCADGNLTVPFEVFIPEDSVHYVMIMTMKCQMRLDFTVVNNGNREYRIPAKDGLLLRFPEGENWVTATLLSDTEKSNPKIIPAHSSTNFSLIVKDYNIPLNTIHELLLSLCPMGEDDDWSNWVLKTEFMPDISALSKSQARVSPLGSANFSLIDPNVVRKETFTAEHEHRRHEPYLKDEADFLFSDALFFTLHSDISFEKTKFYCYACEKNNPQKYSLFEEANSNSDGWISYDHSLRLEGPFSPEMIYTVIFEGYIYSYTVLYSFSFEMATNQSPNTPEEA